MRRARFDERLNAVIEQALKRLYKRMRWAYFRGELREYLAHIGLAVDMEIELGLGKFQEVQEKAGQLMTSKIQRARQKGYLKDYLRKINMMDILIRSHHIRTVSLKALPQEGNAVKKDDLVVRRFTLVK